MARRRLTIKRLDPWSVLKFGAVVNLALLAIGLLVMVVAWFIIERLGIVDQVCEIADTFGFERCGINGGNLFRAFVLLGLLWVVIQTAVFVFLSFLHNLIADLTGGLTITVIDDSPQAPARVQAGGPPTSTAHLGANVDQRYVADPRRPAAPTTPAAAATPTHRSPSTPDQPTRRSTTPPPPVPPLGRDHPPQRHEPVVTRQPDDPR